MSANQKILDEIIKHEIDLKNLSETGTNKIIRIYNRLIDELRSKLKEIDPTAPTQQRYKEKRYRALLEQSETIVGNFYADMASSHYDIMTDYAKGESEWFGQIVNNSIGFSVMSVGLPAEVIKRIVDDTMIEGIPTKEWWKKQDADFRFRYKQEMQTGILAGETINQLSGRLTNNIAPIPRNHARTLSRTGYQSVFQSTRGEMYEENADIIKGIMWTATLDTRTTPICRALDGQTWYLPDYRKWTATRKFPGYPPIHWNCRSTTSPVLKKLEELAKSNKDVARTIDKEPDKARRAALDGTVPKSTNYDQWLKKQPASVQKEVLGDDVYKLWRDGKITSVKQLIDRSGNPLTYEQLYQKYRMVPKS